MTFVVTAVYWTRILRASLIFDVLNADSDQYADTFVIAAPPYVASHRACVTYIGPTLRNLFPRVQWPQTSVAWWSR